MNETNTAGAGVLGGPDPTTPPDPTPPPTESPENGGRKRGPHPDAGKYVVFAAPVPDDRTIDVTADGDAREFSQLGGLSFQLIWGPGEADGQREAKQAALDANPEIKAMTEPGGKGVWLLAPPFMSGKPKLAKAEQPPPIMKGL